MRSGRRLRSPEAMRLAWAAADRKWGSGNQAPEPMNEDLDRRWYVLQSIPQQEVTAASFLIAHRFDHYLPMIAVDEQRGQAIQRRIKPMFPGYVFVHLDIKREAAACERIRELPGIQRAKRAFMRVAGGGYAVLAGDDFAWIGAQEARSLDPNRPREMPFHRGEMVRINAGPLCGFSGEIDRLDDIDRISVLIDALGRKAPVTLSASSLEKL